jgi:subtilisin family serine protease
MKKSLLFLTALMMLGGMAVSQKIYNDYVDGILWVKLKAYHNIKTGEVALPNYKFDMQNLPFYKKIDGKKYGITRFGRAFNIDANEKLNSTYALEFSNSAMVNELIDVLRDDPFVEYAEKVPLDRKSLTPNDIQFANQWHLSKISAIQAWNYFSTGSNVVVAVVDDAVERFHADLNANIWINPGEIAGNGVDDDNNGYVDDINGWDVANNSPAVDPSAPDYDHGTHVAGIVSAATNNGLGVASIGFSTKIMCVKATNSGSSITAGYAGILYAANNRANIINMSWGSSSYSTTAENVINYALDKGCILVAAAGNNNNSSIYYPAAYTGVIGVASTTVDDTKSSFSNYGAWVRISAPGSNILSTTLGSTYGYQSGTSMASPLVAGLLGLMKSLNPTMPNADLVQCLYSSADDIAGNNPSYIGQLGVGRINAQRAMECVAGNLSRPPIADFSSTNPIITAGGSVVFTDQSGYNPTSWEWSFPGGSITSFSGKTPPVIVYNTPGKYSVSLTVANANGNNTVTKTDYVTVSAPPTCLTVNLPIPTGWTPTVYGAGTGGVNGFVNGVNSNLERQKAMFYNVSGTSNTALVAVAIQFGRAFTLDPTRVLTIRVFDGSTGSPGAELAAREITMQRVMSDVQNFRLTGIEFPQAITLPASKQFFVSVDISNLTWDFLEKDSLAIVSNRANESSGTPIWDQGADFIWRRYGTSGSWSLTNAALFIHPYLTSSPAKAAIVNKNVSGCSGLPVAFDGTGSTYGKVLQWQFPGASVPNIVNNNFTPSAIYSAAGSYKAYLLALGGCDDLKVDSAIVTISTSPALGVNAGKNPICQGESTTLTATGAASYTWAPAGGLSATTGGSVTANPQFTTAYTISGTLGSCTSSVIYELEVREKAAAVSLTASQTNITQPTSVTFNASASNGGGNPVFNFFVNNVSQQSGSSTVFVRTVSPGDQVRCQMTSSEACVDQQVVQSNTITLGDNTVPVTLLSFTGRRAGNSNALLWTTASEANTDRFVVERSTDGVTYTAIGEVMAAGNSQSHRTYTYNDNRPATGKNFYRLKMTDLDGSYKYSNVVLLHDHGRGSLLSLQPNPTTQGGNSLLVIDGTEPGAGVVTIATTTGQMVKEIKLANMGGLTQVPLPSNGFAAGTYFVTLRNSKGEVVQTLRWSIVR